MGGPLESIWRAIRGSPDTRAERSSVLARSNTSIVPAPEIEPGDPLVAYLVQNPGPLQIGRLDLESSALRAMRAAGVELVVPLVSQGELVGAINLGPRLSEQDYSVDDQVLLSNLAAQAAPAVRVAQLVKLQETVAVARERLDQELRVAREIQLSLLPKELPRLAGWRVAAYYQPARAVGGDFYDFISLPDGRLGVIVGDVADKGVPAAIVMASTRAIMRAAAREAKNPGQALARANDLLYPDMPRNMFVTCLYAILDPQTGRLEYANAGHSVPLRRHEGEVTEVRAEGMPLGLLSRIVYEEKETNLAPGEMLFLYSDGLVEARNRRRQMFGVPRMTTLLRGEVCGDARGEIMIDCLLAELARFTGADWEQDDDVTIVTIERVENEGAGRPPDGGKKTAGDGRWRVLDEFALPSEAGNEKAARDRIAAAAGSYLSEGQIDRLKTAVAEAVLNAIEHGNLGRAELPVTLQLLASDSDLKVTIRDEGAEPIIPEHTEPDLEAKLAGSQPSRGWGLFLIRNMVDEVRIASDEGRHVLEMVVHLEAGKHGK